MSGTSFAICVYIRAAHTRNTTSYNRTRPTKLEAGVNDVNHFRGVTGGSERMRAVPFTQSLDFSVYDHLKLMEVSTQSFPLPASGSVEFSADITASTPRVVNDLHQTGFFGPSFNWFDPLSPPGPLG